MSEILANLANCILRGKENVASPYPPDMKRQDGALELTKKALESGISATEILQKGLMVGMNEIGDRFSQGKAYIPELLIAAKAMYAAMGELKPYFTSGEAVHKGIVIIGTVSGDLHDIGKNLVRMVLEGDGWKVVDLGVDVKTEQFLQALKEHPEAIVGMSALLTTTMANMKEAVASIKSQHPQTFIFIGGAPVTAEFSEKIGADGYFADPHPLVNFLNKK